MTPIWTDFYCVLQLLIPAKALHGKTNQMLTGKTAFPYQSYQWRLRIGHFIAVLNVREGRARCCADTGDVTIPASECFSSLLCLTLVNSSSFFLKGLIHCSLMSTEWLLLTSAGIALVHRWMVLKGAVMKDKWKDRDTRPVMFNYSFKKRNTTAVHSPYITKAFLGLCLEQLFEMYRLYTQ